MPKSKKENHNLYLSKDTVVTAVKALCLSETNQVTVARMLGVPKSSTKMMPRVVITTAYITKSTLLI